MRIHGDTAWEIASKYSHVLASETRDLAAWIDKALTGEREACAELANSIGSGPYSSTAGWALSERIAEAIRKRT
jgi:hypothetical protein